MKHILLESLKFPILAFFIYMSLCILWITTLNWNDANELIRINIYIAGYLCFFSYFWTVITYTILKYIKLPNWVFIPIFWLYWFFTWFVIGILDNYFTRGFFSDITLWVVVAVLWLITSTIYIFIDRILFRK